MLYYSKNKNNCITLDEYQNFGKGLIECLTDEQKNRLSVKTNEKGEEYILTDDIKIHFEVVKKIIDVHKCFCGVEGLVEPIKIKRIIDGKEFVIGSTCVEKFSSEEFLKFKEIKNRLNNCICIYCLDKGARIKDGVPIHKKCGRTTLTINTLKFNHITMPDWNDMVSVKNCLDKLNKRKYSSYVRSLIDILTPYYEYKFEILI